MPDEPREFAPPPRRADRPFPLIAYVLGWLAICLVAAEGIHSFVDGLLGTGVILVALVPVMIWMMHFRPRR